MTQSYYLGTGGSYFDAGYSLNFEGVPYSRNDFNDDKCYTSSGNIENYGDATQVKLDVRTLTKSYHRSEIVGWSIWLTWISQRAMFVGKLEIICPT